MAELTFPVSAFREAKSAGCEYRTIVGVRCECRVNEVVVLENH